MKNLKSILAILILFIGLQSTAQSLVDGKYSSTFGNISMTTEYDKEFPNGSIIYGDYKESGTISGSYANFEKEIKGTFFNGSSEGKYIFILPFALSANKPISNMNGFWGYTSDNKNDTNTANHWNITAKTGSSVAIKNETNVWSGKWNTTDGDMHLVQVGNKITGIYKGIGTVSATYNPSTRLLTGTFSNEKIRKTGFIKFYFEGNTFKGEWGWTPSMTEGNWDGTKDLKNNKELSKKPTASTNTASSQSSSANQNANVTSSGTTKFTVKAVSLDASGGDNYGFFGCKLFKVTASGRELINSFGKKPSDFFNSTEKEASKLLNAKHKFSNSAQYFREFILENSDLSNSTIKFELEIYTHMKSKSIGSNINYGYKKEILRLDQISFDQPIRILSSVDGTTIFGSGLCEFIFKVSKN